MTAVEALWLTLVVSLSMCVFAYRSQLVELERRHDELKRELEELRKREQRYYAAHMKARTP